VVNFINDKAGSRAKIKKAPSAVVDLDPTNFDSIVKDTTKDVLVEFYAPCKLLFLIAYLCLKWRGHA
jgi:hypothetical protein